MEKNIEIKKLAESDWELLRDVRLEALREDPVAFGKSHDELCSKGEVYWREKLSNTLDNIFVAIDGEEPIGMMGAYQEEGKKVKHIANIWGVYLRKSYRGQGIAQKLLRKLLEEIESKEDIMKINLSVTTSQVAATNLYKKYGFTIAGTLHMEEKEPDGTFCDQHFMEKILRK